MAVLKMIVRRIPVALLCVLLVAVAACAAVLLVRHGQKQRGVGAVSRPTAATAAYGDEFAPRGRFTANVAYTSLDASGSGEVSSAITWDDAWFASEADPTVYNHELAATSSVLAALAYAESGYYQVGNPQPAYMENALSQLGFQQVSTASYRYRSEVVDEVLNLFTNESDTVAYTIARKRLQAEDGASRDLLLVSIRGRYGSEWLSNLNILPGESDDLSTREGSAPVAEESSAEESSAAERLRAELAKLTNPLTDALTSWMSFVASLAGHSTAGEASASVGAAATGGEQPLKLDGADMHSGYFRAAEEICGELGRWAQESQADGAEVTVLLVGHSRGGAIANLVAAELDDAMASAAPSTGDRGDEPLDALSQVSAVYAYTFAAPATTVSADAHAERYGNIFNIVNPADIMPYLPLRAWGYERYGVNLYLPAVDQEGFAEQYDAMRQHYKRIVGTESAYDPEEKHTVDRVLGEVAERVSSAHDLMTPAGVAAIVSSCVANVDPVRILYGHYPTTYIAWMEVLEAGDLTSE